MMSTRYKAVLSAFPLLYCTAAAHALDWQEAPRYNTINLSSGFQPDPQQFEITAGGNTPASKAGSNCTGYVHGLAPDMDFNFEAGEYQLVVYVESSADTTLVVNDADGNWLCNDDFSSSSGTNPAIKWVNPPSGNYNVWVGTLAGGPADATIKFSERDPEWHGSPSPVSSSSGIQWGDDGSEWSHDGECDDPRFEGPSVHSINIEEDRYHDASDCRALYEQGQVFLKPEYR